MPQDIVRDARHQPEDPVLRVQRMMFVYLYGEKAWYEDTFQDERADCLLLATTFHDIFRERWTMFNAAERLTVHSCELVFGSLVPSEQARQAIQDYAESYLEDLSTVFMGDGQMRPAFKPTGRVS